MNVLFITSSFPRHAGDYAGRFVWEHAEALRASGHNLRVLTWADASSATWGPPAIPMVRVRYAPAGHESLFNGSGAPERLESSPASLSLALPAIAAMMLEAQHHREWADIIVGHWLLPSGLIARLVGDVCGLPSLVVGHSGAVHLLAKLPGWARGPLVKMLEGPTTVSSEPLASKAASAGLNSKVLSMGFTSTGARSHGKSWLMMGRHVPIKGFDTGLRALAEAFPGAHVILAGDGPERGVLKSLAQGLGLNAEFVGVVTGNEKRQVLERSRFILFPSQRIKQRHEGLPVSLLEAADAGVIPLIGDVPGAEQLLATTFQQADSTLQAWVQLLRDSERTFNRDWARRQREKVKHLEWSSLGATWSDLLEEVAADYQRADATS